MLIVSNTDGYSYRKEQDANIMKNWSSSPWTLPVTSDTKVLASIVRVCHRWHAIAIELLYSHLHLAKSTHEHIEQVSDTLERSESVSPGRGNGRHVRRIDARLDLLASRWDVLTILRLLSAVNDLRVLFLFPYTEGMIYASEWSSWTSIYVFDAEPFAHLAALLEHRFKHSMRALSIIGAAPLIYTSGLLPNVRLEMLELTCSPRGIVLPYEVVDTLQNLTIDVSSFNMGLSLDYTFPSLTTLALDNIETADIERWADFIRLHSSQLTSLRVSSPESRDCHYFNHLFRPATRLKNLALESNHLFFRPFGSDTPPITAESEWDPFPSVERIVISDVTSAVEDKILLLFPKLREIGVWAPAISSAFYVPMQMLKERGVTVWSCRVATEEKAPRLFHAQVESSPHVPWPYSTLNSAPSRESSPPSSPVFPDLQFWP